MTVSINEVGQFIDGINAQADRWRTTSSVASRFIEEAVELGLAAGLTPTQIMASVMDSIHNQCVKQSRKLETSTASTVYPSQVHASDTDYKELEEELADCVILLKDLAWVADISFEQSQIDKWEKFKKRRFHVSETGLLYGLPETDKS